MLLKFSDIKSNYNLNKNKLIKSCVLWSKYIIVIYNKIEKDTFFRASWNVGNLEF